MLLGQVWKYPCSALLCPLSGPWGSSWWLLREMLRKVVLMYRWNVVRLYHGTLLSPEKGMNYLLIHRMSWMNFENVIFSESSPSHKTTVPQGSILSKARIGRSLETGVDGWFLGDGNRMGCM